MSLRDDVDRLLPGWESWYPSLFHAAEDLGLIRARVCSPSSLMISQRHAKVYSEAVHAFRVQWSAEESEGDAQILPFKNKHTKGGRQAVAPKNRQILDTLRDSSSASDDALDHLLGDNDAGSDVDDMEADSDGYDELGATNDE